MDHRREPGRNGSDGFEVQIFPIQGDLGRIRPVDSDSDSHRPTANRILIPSGKKKKPGKGWFHYGQG